MKLRLKDGVKLDGIDLEVFAEILLALRDVAMDMKLSEVVITSALDGKHSEGSLHPKGKALDIRTKNLKDRRAKKRFKDLMAEVLNLDAFVPGQYDVILEDLGGPNEHLHCEYDPR